MDNNLLSYYRILGKVESSVAKSKTVEEALQSGINIISNELKVDNIIVWYEDTKSDSVLHPYYWICPIDFSYKSHKDNEGSVGRVYHSQKSERYLNYNHEDSYSDNDFKGIEIGSMVCVPLSNKYDKLGAVQFVNEKNHNKFSEEEADLFEMLVSLIAITIDEKLEISKPLEDKNVIISVKDIKKSFKSGDTITQVLKGVNLNIYEGEFVVLLGESGCGKSTLLNIIGGLNKADSGEFYFMGKDMSKASEKELTKYRRDNIGFIFQSYNLMPNLNARENLELIGELVDDPMDSDEALDLVNMKQKFRSYPSALSGGQQQRISIARALIKKPKIIMADEPTAALDYETSILVLKTLEDVKKTGTTLIMVTHNEAISLMADRVVRFRNGRMHEVKVNKHPLHAEELVW